MRIRSATICLCAGIAGLAVSMPPLPANAEDEGVDDGSQRCLNARSIRRTEVVDDNNVVFEIQGRRLFLNQLPKSCTGLSENGRFSFEISTRSLCAGDKIRILREAGSTFYEGKSCSLGRFRPVTVEELLEAERRKMSPPPPQKVESADVEDVVTD